MANVLHLSTNFISSQFLVVFNDLFKTVIRIGVDETVIESIFQDLFQFNEELYAEEVLNKAGNIIYQPPPLHEVWLDETGQQQGNEDCIRQHRRNDDLMRDPNRAVQQAVPTPVTTVNNADDDLDMLPISDDDRVDSSLYFKTQNLREVFGTINTMIMSLLLQREHSLFHQMMTAIERPWLVHQLEATLVLNVWQHVMPPILFRLQYKLLRELPVEDMGNSTLQPYGDVVLMAKWRELQYL